MLWELTEEEKDLRAMEAGILYVGPFTVGPWWGLCSRCSMHLTNSSVVSVFPAVFFCGSDLLLMFLFCFAAFTTFTMDFTPRAEVMCIPISIPNLACTMFCAWFSPVMSCPKDLMEEIGAQGVPVTPCLVLWSMHATRRSAWGMG